MGAVYATLDDLIESSPRDWSATDDEVGLRKLEEASAIIRQAFKSKRVSLDQWILEDKVEPSILRMVVCDMVHTSMAPSLIPFGGDVSQVSESANGVSRGFSFSPGSSSKKLYIHANELKKLGLPSFVLGGFDIGSGS